MAGYENIYVFLDKDGEITNFETDVEKAFNYLIAFGSMHSYKTTISGIARYYQAEN